MSERHIGNSAQGNDGRSQFQTSYYSRHRKQVTIRVAAMVLVAIAMCCAMVTPAVAQGAPYYAPDQLERMVSRVALYPDPLLAQTLAAATFPDQIPDAAGWADQHHYLTGERLAVAINNDQLSWDPSVQALLPFPSVLSMMASDMNWTSDLGNAFLAQQEDVMAAVQRMRMRARDYGYLRTGPEYIVAGGPYITILPARPEYVVVPYYDPVVVYARPRPGFFVGSAIVFRFGVPLGVAFRPWGWGYNRIAWDHRVVFINNSPWHRTWVNRREYVHPYTVRRVVVAERHEERHELVKRNEHEREEARYSHARAEEHREEHGKVAEYRHDDHDRGHDNRGHDNGHGKDNGHGHDNGKDHDDHHGEHGDHH